MEATAKMLREALKPSAAAAGFLVVVGGTVGMMAAQLPIPEPWWGFLGAAGLWAWRNVGAERSG